MEEIISIPEIMFHPARMRKSLFMDELLSTLITEPIQDVDDCISEAVSCTCSINFFLNYMFI